MQNLIERGVISAEDGVPIDVAHMFRRKQLSEEALLPIGAHGALTARRDVAEESLLDHLAERIGHDGLSMLSIEQ